MQPSALLPVLAIVGLVVYRLLAYLDRKRKDAAFAREHNCLPPPTDPLVGFLGFKIIGEMREADRNQQFLTWVVDRSARVAKAIGRPASTITSTVLGKQGFFTTDPKNIQTILALKFEDFDLGSQRRTIMGAALGDGIFTQDGDKWAHSRALLRPNFVRDQVSDLAMNERHIQDVFTVMPVQSDGWTKFTNIQEIFFRMTVDSATEFLFGESTHTQIKAVKSGSDADGKRDERAFAYHFDSAQRHMSSKFRFGEFHWLYNPKDFKTDVQIVNDFVDYYVDLALQKSKSGELQKQDPDKYVFLDALALQTQDRIQLRAQLLNILLAGRDTTASLLSWLFHELLRHPDVFEKLRETVISTFGPYSATDTSSITFASLKSCQYLQHALNETLRFWPVVPGNSRRSNKRTTLPRGGGPDGQSPVFVPADHQVDYSVYLMMRRKDLWGEDADQFKPERFASRKVGWDYLPFNGGPRICIGQQFALTEASYVTVRILQRFDKIEAPPGDLEKSVLQNLSLTSCPGRPVTLRAREARD